MDQPGEQHSRHGLAIDRRGRYVLLRIPGKDCGVHGDLSSLIGAVDQLVKDRIRDLVVVFEESAYLHTRAIAALVRCYAMVEDVGGTFAIVAPNPMMMRAIKLAGVDSVMKAYASESDLPE